MSNIKLFAIVLHVAEDNHDSTQIAILLARDDNDLTCSVSCFGGYVTSPPPAGSHWYPKNEGAKSLAVG